MTIRSLSDEEVCVRLEGDTWSFKSNFANVNVPGRYETSDGAPLPANTSQLEKKKNKGFYVRVIRKWDVSDEEKAKFLVDMIKRQSTKTPWLLSSCMAV